MTATIAMAIFHAAFFGLHVGFALVARLHGYDDSVVINVFAAALQAAIVVHYAGRIEDAS